MLAASAVSGTPGYMSPELWAGKRGDALTDVFCSGLRALRKVQDRHKKSFQTRNPTDRNKKGPSEPAFFN
jgi:serine/threonine protein kinase